MKRGIRLILLTAALASLFVLTGCTLGSNVESLFTLPQLPEDYRDLSTTLEGLLDEGHTYLTPTDGPNIESVQMVDLDGDGQKEAVALMRHSGDRKPLKVMIFQQLNGRFECFCTVEHAGAGIDSIDYCDLIGDGTAELIIGWRSEEGQQTLSLCRIEQESVPLLESEYSEYLLQDLVGDGIPGLLLLRENREAAGESPCVAEYYTWRNESARLHQTCPIDSDMEAIRRGSVVNGLLSNGVPAVFITSVQEKNIAKTDVLLNTGEELLNIAQDSGTYRYCRLKPQDIDGDGSIEVPYPLRESGAGDTAVWSDGLIGWARYNARGEMEKVAETYHCQSYGWYMTWPEEYWDLITVSSGDIVSGENCVEFSVQGEPVAALYSITNESRESRAQMGARFIVTRLPSTIYAGEIYGSQAGNASAKTMLRDNFSLIVNTWDSAGKE